MTRRIWNISIPERVVVGTVGMPGERTFYLQIRSQDAVTSVILEKQQASILAEKLDQLLDEVKATRAEVAVPAQIAVANDLDPLEVPLVEEFRVGSMALGWDDSQSLVIVEAHAIAEDGQDVPDLTDDDGAGPDTLRVWLTPLQAREFSARARAVVSAGRPACPFCQQPLDPDGHICPRANGYRRRDF